ncbi:MAG TPA: hypothetical protein VGZ47_12865, partial [Gemmataceae bacterium]|nr:hypothetical protein [Gemmataceae bacterium]
MTHSFSAGRWLILAGCLIMAAAVGLYLWAPWRSRPGTPVAPPTHVLVDPRVAYQGPYLNVRPNVKYVGDAVCAECHADIAKTYHHHPMGRSLQPIAQAQSPPDDPAH